MKSRHRPRSWAWLLETSDMKRAGVKTVTRIDQSPDIQNFDYQDLYRCRRSSRLVCRIARQLLFSCSFTDLGGHPLRIFHLVFATRKHPLTEARMSSSVHARSASR